MDQHILLVNKSILQSHGTVCKTTRVDLQEPLIRVPVLLGDLPYTSADPDIVSLRTVYRHTYIHN